MRSHVYPSVSKLKKPPEYDLYPLAIETMHNITDTNFSVIDTTKNGIILLDVHHIKVSLDTSPTKTEFIVEQVRRFLQYCNKSSRWSRIRVLSQAPRTNNYQIFCWICIASSCSGTRTQTNTALFSSFTNCGISGLAQEVWGALIHLLLAIYCQRRLRDSCSEIELWTKRNVVQIRKKFTVFAEKWPLHFVEIDILGPLPKAI